MANTNPWHVVTGEARLSYVNILKPVKKANQDKEKYSVTILIPKSDTATRGRIDAAIEAAIGRGAKESWGGRPPQIAIPIYDGDGTRPSDGLPFGAECKGHWVFTATSTHKPEFVDAGLNPIINENEVYSGFYGRVSVDFFPYGGTKEVAKKGIGCALGNVQKTRDGEHLAGGTTAEEDFGAAPAAYTPAQAPYTQPAYATPAAPQGAPGYYGAPAAYAPTMYAQPTQQPGPIINPITGQPM